MKRNKTPRPIRSKHVPYVKPETLEKARPHLPSGPDDVLTVSRVSAFTAAASRDPEVPLAVLGTLRAHANNGGESPLAGAGAFFAALAVFVAVTFPALKLGLLWVLFAAWAIFLLIAAMVIVRISFAAQARRVIAVAWLGAYEDALGHLALSASKLRRRGRLRRSSHSQT